VDSAGLTPLAPGERPPALLVAVAVAVLLAAGVLASALTVHDLARHGGSLPGGIFIAGVLLALAHSMYRRRYWAVLGFEALLAFQIIVTSMALVVADTLATAGLCALGIALSGWLFYKLVRVMGRVQATERSAAADAASAPAAHTNAPAAHTNAPAAHTNAPAAHRSAPAAATDTDEALR
jgi:hypothetical protein